jgi:hypothetical protein
VTLGRAKTQGRCKKQACQEPAQSRNLCRSHYDQWYYRRGHLRCHWEGCRAFQDDGGRRMKHGNKVLFFCRLHEVEHLRWTPQVQQTNLNRLAEKITRYGECWIASGPVMGKKGEYVGFVPEGAGTAQWVFHRVLWDLLVGGHRPGYELDHMPPGCKPACCNPAHLEPVKRSENERRKRRPRRVTVNWAAAETQAVKDFAQEHDLPLPVRVAPSPA